MYKNRIRGIRRRASRHMTAKPISIKGAGCKFGGCVRKAAELTSGDLPFVSESRLRWKRFLLTGRQKSAEGEVVRQRMKARTVIVNSSARLSWRPCASQSASAELARGG